MAQLAADNLPASLILPMGRLGPAFLAYPNFKAYIEWNAAIVYSTTAAYFATRLAGAPPCRSRQRPAGGADDAAGPGAAALLIARRMLTGEADGRLGSATRAAVKQAQLKVGLPADAYPTPELIERLRAGASARHRNRSAAAVNCGINARSTISCPNRGR